MFRPEANKPFVLNDGWRLRHQRTGWFRFEVLAERLNRKKGDPNRCVFKRALKTLTLFHFSPREQPLQSVQKSLRFLGL